MRMSPTDVLDVTGATYTYLVNGQPLGANWTALFQSNERISSALHQRILDEHFRCAHPRPRDARRPD
jgi:hypothetical protein